MALAAQVSRTRLGGQTITGGGESTKNGRTQVLVTPPQLKMLTVMLWLPGPTTVPAAGDCVMVRVPQPPPVMQMELVSTERSGTTPTHALVVNSGMSLSCRHAQFTESGELFVTDTVWLQRFVLAQRSVSAQVRVTDSGQTLFVRVLTTETVTLVPLHKSTPTGGSKMKGAPQGTVLFVVAQLATTDTSSK